MTLHLIELEIDWLKVLQGAAVRDGTDPGYHLHAWLSGTFGPSSLQPFRWLEERRRLLGYSTESGEMLLAKADLYAGAEARAAIVRVHSKVLPEQWPDQVQMGFAVRAVPTVRLSKAIEGRAPKGGEVDAFNAARWQGRDATRSEVYEDWLRDQLDRHGAVTLDRFSLDGHQLARMVRRPQGGARKARAIVLPEMTATGVFTLRDGDAFHRLLARGVGRHRAFGFGMLLLRPPC